MRLNITIDNKKYEVEVEVAEPEPPAAVYLAAPRSNGVAPAPKAAEDSAAPQGQTVSDEAKACRSPLSGVVSEIQVETGNDVAHDAPVMVLEAMKMFTTITSPVSGKVKQLAVKVGDAVKQGQLLVEFE
jgi:biotin carboxyl carrier protein